MARESQYLMALRFQKGSLGGKTQILAPGLLIKIMAEKDLQIRILPSLLATLSTGGFMLRIKVQRLTVQRLGGEESA